MESISQLSVIILAAGKGTRMKSAKAKVLHEVFFQPMLHHVLESVRPLEPARCLVVVGHQEEAVRKSLRHHDVELVRQEHQLGTGHAVQMTQSAVPEGDGVVMILCGDTPLISSQSLQEMYRNHLACRSVLTVMTTIVADPTGYGRIISAGDSILAIVEEKETDEQQRKIQEINAGIYLVEKIFLFEALASLTPDNSQGEFYLTDIVAYAVSQKQQAQKYLNPAADEVLGVNSKVELEAAHRQLQQRRNQELMRQGVTIHDRATVTVSRQSEIGSDTLLLPGAFVAGHSTIGSNCIIENGAILHDCTVGDNTRIGAYCVLRNCRIDNDVSLPPMTLREQ